MAQASGVTSNVSTSNERALVKLIRAGTPPHGAPRESTAFDLTANDWESLVPLARKHGVSGLLYQAIQTLQRDKVPSSVLATLRETYLNTHLVQRLAYEELAALLAEFQQQNLEMIVLKGAALAKTIYPDAALRPFGDLDLLIHPEDNARAVEILRARNYEMGTDMGTEQDSALWGQQTFYRTGNHPARVELHWHLFVMPYYRKRAPLAWFWEHRASFEFYQHTAQAFDAIANLLHLSAHSSLHHHDTRLIWLYDLALLMERERERLDWHSLVETAQAFGLGRALQHALTQASETWNFALPAPRALQKISTSPYERVMFTLARSNHRQARWLADGIALGGTQYWRAHLFPAPAYMRERYRIQHDALLPFWYIARLGSAIYKFARANLALVFQKRENHSPQSRV